MGPELRTPRLLLRRWRAQDRSGFARLNSNPEVMAYLPSILSPLESDALADRLDAAFDQHGFGVWAVEVVGAADFIGFVGLSVPAFTAHFTPAVEIGWRLDQPYWGKGYATEGARAAVAFGFEAIGLREIVSFTVPANVKSRHVMERLGMTHNEADDFDHPRLPEGHRLRRHVLYRLTRD